LKKQEQGRRAGASDDGAFDLHDDGVMEQPVEERSSDDGIAEDCASNTRNAK